MPWMVQSGATEKWGIRHEKSAFQVNAFQNSAFQTGEGQKASWTAQSSDQETWG